MPFPFPSIQMKFDEDWGEIYGSPGATTMTVTLNSGEHIMVVSGTFDMYISHLFVATNTSRQMMLGSYIAKSAFLESSSEPDYVLRAFCAYYVTGGLRAINPMWGPVNGTCAE